MIDKLARQIAFFAPAAVMSAWATVMLHTYATGHLNRLLSPMFRGYVLTAAIMLLVLSALHLLLYQAETTPTLAPATRLRQLGRWLVLLIPVVAASVLSPTALSSTTLSNRAASSTAGVAAMPSMSAQTKENVQNELSADPNQPVPVEVTDLITLSRSPDQIKAFDNRKVRTVGFLINKPGESPKLVRWIMWCCAADAQPVAVNLTGNLSGNWKDTEWLEITGTAKFPSTLGHAIPEIEVDTIKHTDEPDEPYLSP